MPVRRLRPEETLVLEPMKAGPAVGGIATVQADPYAENTGATWSERTYPRGALATSKVLFTVGGVATTPDTVTATVYLPDGTSSTPAPGTTSTGLYAVALDTTTAAGRWLVRWVGTGACQAAVEDVFWVQSAS